MMQVNKEYQSKLAQEKNEQQRAYSDILSSQLRLKEEIGAKYGTMTENERKMNNKELSAFKSNDAAVSSFIPGINNLSSVGSKPTCRGGKAIVMGTGFSNSPIPQLTKPQSGLKVGERVGTFYCNLNNNRIWKHAFQTTKSYRNGTSLQPNNESDT